MLLQHEKTTILKKKTAKQSEIRRILNWSLQNTTVLFFAQFSIPSNNFLFNTVILEKSVVWFRKRLTFIFISHINQNAKISALDS